MVFRKKNEITIGDPDIKRTGSDVTILSMVLPYTEQLRLPIFWLKNMVSALRSLMPEALFRLTIARLLKALKRQAV